VQNKADKVVFNSYLITCSRPAGGMPKVANCKTETPLALLGQEVEVLKGAESSEGRPPSLELDDALCACLTETQVQAADRALGDELLCGR